MMKRNITFCIIVAVSILLSACSSASKDAKAISALEEESYEGFDTVKLNNLITSYHKYIADYPDDSLAPEYLLRAGSIYMKLGHGDEAINDFDRLIETYPGFEKLPEVYYYRAYTFEGVLYDIFTAKIAYEDFIDRYPDHYMANDARMSIKYLGMSPEEIVKSFETETTDTLEE